MKRRRLGLMARAVIGLLCIAGLPLLASAILIKEVALAAQRVAIGEAEKLHAALDRARDAYVEAVDARKAAFRHAADAVATRGDLAAACAGAQAARTLHALLTDDPLLAGARLRAADGSALAEESRTGGPSPDGPVRSLHLDRPVAGGCRLELTYATATGARLADDYQALGEVLTEHRQLEKIRANLPPSYRTPFLIFVGGVVTLTTAIAILFARHTTRRIDRLVSATRRVAEGDLDSRVALEGKDELADLAHAFDDMVVEIARSRAELDYLHKIAAWQEVARRLAHEIKNPLTPIQLAVQELHSKYAGDDPRFRKMLDDAREIVSEEIAGLRRLVDAFSGFAQLPRVEARPLDLAVVLDDVAQAGKALELEPPAAPVTVAGDRLLLKRVLANLVENASQAGARRVRVGWRAAGEWALVTVDDDGPGVPPAQRGRIFDPYVTSKPHGTGLGLAIVKKTLLEHGGTIALAEAKSPLGGARFELKLPLAD